ncbi:MAG: hypothetical protein ACK4E1_05605 [Fervidobacterium nodosum]
MAKFYACEIEYDKGSIKIAIEKSLVSGISEKFIPGPEKDIIFGFAEHGNFLYPIVTHSKLSSPVLKYFIILQKYAFGVTRVIEEIEGEIIPISPNLPIQKGSKFESISEYIGVVQKDREFYYVYNIHNVELPIEARVISSEEKEEKKTKIDSQKADFVVIGGKYAVRKSNVKTIVSFDLVTPYKFHGYDGFIDYKKIIPVKNIDEGKFIVVLDNIAYRTGKITLVSGNELYHESGKKMLETDEGTYEIIE